MISYVKGPLMAIEEDVIVVEAGHVGLAIHVPVSLLPELPGRFRGLPGFFLLCCIPGLLRRQLLLFLLFPDFPLPLYPLFFSSFPDRLFLHFAFRRQFPGRFPFLHIIPVQIIPGSGPANQQQH